MSSNNSSTNEYDLAVIGAGSGGLAAARRAAKHGAKVCVIENYKIGGVCVNLGCVPKKLMVYAADMLHNINTISPYYSIKDNNIKTEKKDSQAENENKNTLQQKLVADIDWKQFVANRNSAILSLNKIFEQNLKKEGVEFIPKTATLDFDSSSSKNYIQLYEDFTKKEKCGTIHSKFILVATGSTPRLPPLVPNSVFPIPSLPLTSTIDSVSSDAIFKCMEERPKRVVIVGSGYIGVELTHVLSSLGVTVDLISRKKFVLTNFDETIQEKVTESLRNLKNVNLISGVSVLKYSNEKLRKRAFNSLLTANLSTENEGNQKKVRLDDEKKCFLSDGSVIEGVDYLIYSIGRVPNLSFFSSNPEHPCLKSEEFRKSCNTSNPLSLNPTSFLSSLGYLKDVFFIGDLFGSETPMLTPYAIKCGRYLADNLFSKSSTYSPETGSIEPFKLPKYIPTVVFSYPAVGSCGLSTKEAIDKLGEENLEIKESRFDGLFYNVPKQAGIQKKDIDGCAIKVIIDKLSREVVGIHLVGEFAKEAMQGFALAMNIGVKYEDFEKCVAIHPTASEDVVLI